MENGHASDFGTYVTFSLKQASGGPVDMAAESSGFLQEEDDMSPFEG